MKKMKEINIEHADNKCLEFIDWTHKNYSLVGKGIFLKNYSSEYITSAELLRIFNDEKTEIGK